MSQMPQSISMREKVQELSRRMSQDMSMADTSSHQRPQRVQDSVPRKEPAPGSEQPIPGNGEHVKAEEKPKIDNPFSPARQMHECKNPFSPQMYRSSRPHGYFEMGPRGLDHSPHRMGMELSNRLREHAPQRSSSVHGHELTDTPLHGDYLPQRAHFGSQVAAGGMVHAEVAFRQEYYGPVIPRAARFSSQEYLNAPAHYGRWPDYRADYRQRRRSQQDLHSFGQNPESGTPQSTFSFIISFILTGFKKSDCRLRFTAV